MHLSIVVGFCLVGLSQLASAAPLAKEPINDHIKHIGHNNTHLIQLNDQNFIIINPNVHESILVFTMQHNHLQVRLTGQISNSPPVFDRNFNHAEKALSVYNNLMELSKDPVFLPPGDRFISTEYPNDGSAIRIVHKQNYDSIAVRGDEHATVVYDASQFSVFDEKLVDWADKRIFWLENFLIVTDTHPEKPFLYAIHGDYLAKQMKENMQTVIAQVYETK